MQVTTTYTNAQAIEQKTNTEKSNQNAFAILYEKEQKDTKQEQSDAEVKSFLESLLSKGALAFLADLNQEKIDKLVQEFRDKLIKERGDNPESLKEIESLVADFKKQLLEKLEESLDNDESNLKISANALFKTLLEMTEPQDSAFSKLLQEK